MAFNLYKPMMVGLVFSKYSLPFFSMVDRVYYPGPLISHIGKGLDLTANMTQVQAINVLVQFGLALAQ